MAPDLYLHVARYRYGALLLFDNLRLTARGGAWTALLGPSGGGKSTLLRLIAGLLPGGNLHASDGAPIRGRVALMAQDDGLLPWLSARDNVLLGPRLRGERSPAQTTRALDLLTQVGLEDRADALPHQLSGGMRQRVALARTLMEDRAFVLLDEPFSALDALTRRRLQDLAFDLLRARTVLLVTHSPEEALRLAEDVVLLTGLPARPHRVNPPQTVPPRDPASADFAHAKEALLVELAADAPA